jgi:hypothetical protein
MITRKTVFVLGSGASKPYGYPTGEELIREIINLSENVKFMDFLSRAFVDHQGLRIEEVFNDLIQRLAQSGLTSIDSFLSTVDTDAIASKKTRLEVGRFAVAYIIFTAQTKNWNNLAVVKTDSGASSGDWYRYLYNQTLFMKDRKPIPKYESFLENEISFITFNYDVSLDYFFYSALTSAYGSQIDFSKFLEKIVHVYGRINTLPGDPDPFRGSLWNAVGGLTSPSGISHISKSIQFLHDQDGLPENLNIRVARMLDSAKSVIFLGFGFHPENVMKLQIDWNRDCQFYGTALETTDSEKAKIYNDVGSITTSGNKLGLKNTDCLGLLRNFIHIMN